MNCSSNKMDFQDSAIIEGNVEFLFGHSLNQTPQISYTACLFYLILKREDFISQISLIQNTFSNIFKLSRWRIYRPPNILPLHTCVFVCSELSRTHTKRTFTGKFVFKFIPVKLSDYWKFLQLLFSPSRVYAKFMWWIYWVFHYS